MKYGNSINLTQSELQNAVIQNLASVPANPLPGQVYYDTALLAFGCYQNAVWVYLGSTTNEVSKTANASAAGVLQVSGGTDKTIADFTSAGGIVKVSSTGVVTLAVAGTDYSAGTSGLTTGILKSTTGTGTQTIAVAADFPTLNQNTSGSAASLSAVLNTSSVPAFTGDVSNTAGSLTSTIGLNVVTLPKIATVPTQTLLGNPAATTGNVTSITLGSGVALSTGGILSATGNGGTVTTESVVTANGFSGTVANATTTPAITISTTVSGLVKGSSGALTAATISVDYISPSSSESLTNKTISAGNNTISGLSTTNFATNIIDTDSAATANSDLRIMTQKAVLSLVTTKVTGLATPKGGIDASTNPNYPAAAVGDFYRVTVAGIIGGASGISVAVGDVMECFIASAAGTQAAVGANWTVVEGKVYQATNSTLGLIAIATLTETEAKSNSTKSVVPSDLTNFPIKRTFTIGDGTATSFILTHNLNTTAVDVKFRFASNGEELLTDNYATGVNTLNVVFRLAPSLNQIVAQIIG